MKRYAVLILVLGISGCVAVPVGGPPGAYADLYVSPPPLVVARPHYYGYSGYGWGYRGNWRHWR